MFGVRVDSKDPKNPILEARMIGHVGVLTDQLVPKAVLLIEMNPLATGDLWLSTGETMHRPVPFII